MKLVHHLAAAAVAVIAALITVYLWERGSEPAAPMTSPTHAVGLGSSAGASAATPRRVRTMMRDERDKLRAQIRASIANRVLSVGHGSGPIAVAPDGPPPGAAPGTQEIELPTLRLEDAGPDLQGALQEAIPLLADCYGPHKPDAGRKQAAAMMTMISDPELGTVIDTERVTDATGAPLTDVLENCLRDAIESLALPGLDQPGALPLQYTFVFD